MNTTGLRPERVDALLAARSAALAARSRASREVEETRAYLVCACGAERYALPLAEVSAVISACPVTPVPGSPAALLGVVALSGSIVSVLALGRMLGIQAGGVGHFVRLRGQEPPVVLAVDRAVGVFEIGVTASSASPFPGGLGGQAVSGYCPPDPNAAEGAREGCSILDLPRLLQPFLP